MLAQVGFGVLLVMVTTCVHAAGTAAGLAVLRRSHASSWGLRSKRWAVLLVASFVTLMFLAAVVEVGVWAAFYLGAGAIAGLESALYFSAVTFTTLGYGDITLSPDWRLLASFEAMNGIILFGWTTALVVMLVQRVAEDFRQPE